MGGKVAALSDQSDGIIWSSNNTGVYDGGVSIWGIDQTSTVATPSPTSTQYAGQFNCNGSTDGSCNTNNIFVYYSIIAPPTVSDSDYASGLCKGTIGGYSNWYLPSICEMGSPFFCSLGIQNMQVNLANSSIGFLLGPHWSSTEWSTNPQSDAYSWDFNFGLDASLKSMFLKIRCTRSLT